jgi:hypothetical protein
MQERKMAYPTPLQEWANLGTRVLSLRPVRWTVFHVETYNRNGRAWPTIQTLSQNSPTPRAASSILILFWAATRALVPVTYPAVIRPRGVPLHGRGLTPFQRRVHNHPVNFGRCGSMGYAPRGSLVPIDK